MDKRICPEEIELAEYLSGSLPPSERSVVEEHLSSCRKCRELVSGAYDVMRQPCPASLVPSAFIKIKENIWLLPSAVFLGLSFIFRNYFFQLLAAAVLCGIKWVIDARATHLLIMINKSLKDDGDDTFSPRKDHTRRASK